MTAAVLVVEDNKDLLLLLSHIFRRAGIEMHSAGSVEEAWGTLSNDDPPDAVVMDVALPEGDGWELLERIRASERFGGLPVIVLTGDVRSETKARATGLRATFIAKPFRSEELIAAVKGTGGSDPMPE